MTQSRPNSHPTPAGKSAPPTSRRSARQQRLANREANRRLARAATSGASGGGLRSIALWTVIALVVGAAVIVGAYLLTSKSGSGVALESPIAPRVVTPASIPSEGRTLGNADAKVTIDMWGDFRCTACFDFTMNVEPQVVTNFVETGKAKFVFHDLITIDANQPGVTESRDAANAALCAADQGKFWLYHDWLYANQSPDESPGAFTLNRLVEIGQDAGLNMSTFEPCVRNGTHLSEVAAEQAAAPSDNQGTPSIYINGKLVVAAAGANAVPTYEDIAAAINAVLNPASPSPSASPAASSSAAPTSSAGPTATAAPTASPS